MRKNIFLLILILFMVPVFVFAQKGDIQGRVVDKSSGEGIAGANVIVEGTTLGAATDVDGNFAIIDVPAGTIKIVVTVIGYAKVDQEVIVTSGRTVKVNFQLEREALELGALEVLASRATRETPVAYTNVEKIEIELSLGSRDMPMVLNTTPSVYATEQGGGAGDARISVRGFNQRNVAVMINGVPVNDMENGWVYWSNWDGVADATSSIQLQRGLSAVNLAAPSIGGTMNILTDPTALKAGGRFKQEFGSGGFLKSTLSYASGLINDKFAVSGTVVRKKGKGVIDKAWTDAWAYYLGASYQANKNNRFELFALGAPQRHGQMRYA
ncbi:MAG: TonB-dependent receptor, partial [Candidatus Marinimicrobia bacterium]|nr:TonB-dependent receptor [Candidatus Neomarinimicrobiota bacterium]